MTIPDTNDPEALALSALGWALSEQSRAERLLALTGLTPQDLRERLGDPSLLAAVLGFLEAHEPDLVACAEVLGVTPAAIVDARRRLER
jgi:adenine/guanine phosphoribosyltransferase-like PRPP-binding protein